MSDLNPRSYPEFILNHARTQFEIVEPGCVKSTANPSCAPRAVTLSRFAARVRRHPPPRGQKPAENRSPPGGDFEALAAVRPSRRVRDHASRKPRPVPGPSSSVRHGQHLHLHGRECAFFAGEISRLGKEACSDETGQKAEGAQ